MASRLTVVTGPAGVDIGPVAAAVGATVDDGLAVRVVKSVSPFATPAHTSPDPFHGPDAEVRLRYLPSAWQDPQTNLGVVFTGHAHSALKDDVHTLDALGLNPSHRLTVQALSGQLRHDYTFPAPIEVGDLGMHARDSVLRAGGHVLVEAGDGMTHLEALAALRLPPWAPWIDQLALWTVFDVAAMDEHLSPGEQLTGETIAHRVCDRVGQIGGVTLLDNVESTVVVLGLPTGIPGSQVAALVFGCLGEAVHTVIVGLDGITTR